MKNIKDITLSIFAIIGFISILSSFNNQPQETHETPESHIWEMHLAAGTSAFRAFSINKVTGEVRTHNAFYSTQFGKNASQEFGTYRVSEPK